ncbi:MAG: YCF48-related protein, partial [Ignavibacteriaceae bacterium]|nr:YCF48-related protein [Ignavibacteriaceae bacterium]
GSLPEWSAIAQQTDSTSEYIHYKRNDSTFLENYNPNDKAKYFPLNKVTAGTGVWTELNPNVPRVDYIGVDFINPDTGWACGGSGAIIKTTDGGNDWTISETPVTNLLLKIHSYNGQIVIATGYDGIILCSSDAGETFEQVVSGVGSGIDLWGVKMLNDTLGWACGMNQTLLKTTDAGLSWQLINAGLNQHYWSIDFLNEHYGMIACGGGKILKTTDGGNSWAAIQAGDTRALYTIDIIDSLHIAVGGATGKNCYSSDGGLTWIQNTNLIYENGVNCVAFINTDTGYAVGEQWAIRKTTNRGVSWFASDPVYGEWQLDLLEGGIGYAAGNELRIYKTENGYDNWEKLFFNINIADVYFTDEMTGYIAGGEPVYKTTDGGQSWFGLPNFPIGLFTSTLTSITFTDSVTGFASSSNTTVKTTDAGESWYEPNGLPGGIGRFFFLNKNTGWGTSGKNILKTTDGGENWTTQFTVPNGSFSSINFVDSLNGWATIFSRRPYKTTDGGLNWIERTDLDIWESDNVYFYDYLKGWIISGNKLYYTTNSGNDWIQDPQIYTYSRNFERISDTHFIITGTNIYESVDTGIVWQNITSQVGSYFTALHAPKNYLAYGVGPLGYIVTYLDTSIIPVELVEFTVKQINNHILIKWITATETNNYGFEIFRSIDLDNWIKIGFVPGYGTTTETQNYSFIDNRLNDEKIYYKLKQLDLDGSFYFSEIINANIQIQNFELKQNYPNPANPITNISFSIPHKSFVKINLYSINGEHIKELIKEEKERGIYNLEINLSNLSSGVYFYRMITDNGYQSTQKLIILK